MAAVVREHRRVRTNRLAAAAAATVAAVTAGSASVAGRSHHERAAAVGHHEPAAACRNGQLSATVTNLSAATGSVVAEGFLSNISASSCTQDGYPRVTFADAAGRTTGESRTTRPGRYAGQLLGRAPAPLLVTLAPKAHAVFWIAWTDMPVGQRTEASCIVPTRELVAPAGRLRWIVVSQRLYTQVCGGLTVEPVERSGYSPNPNQLTG
jgi:hypothetical protein